MKILPNDIEAEQSVIVACLIDEDCISSSTEVLVPDNFYREDNKTKNDSAICDQATLKLLY